MSTSKWDRLMQKQQLRVDPEPTPYERMIELAEVADGMRDLVEAQRKKLVDAGYPEAVSWRMAADLWAGIWRGGNG